MLTLQRTMPLIPTETLQSAEVQLQPLHHRPQNVLSTATITPSKLQAAQLLELEPETIQLLLLMLQNRAH